MIRHITSFNAAWHALDPAGFCHFCPVPAVPCPNYSSNLIDIMGSTIPELPDLVNVYITNWKDPPFYSWVNPRTKSPFSIAFCMFTRG